MFNKTKWNIIKTQNTQNKKHKKHKKETKNHIIPSSTSNLFIHHTPLVSALGRARCVGKMGRVTAIARSVMSVTGGDGAGREAEPQQDLSQGAMDMAICVGKTVGTIQGENLTNPWEITGQLPLDNVNPGFS